VFDFCVVVSPDQPSINHNREHDKFLNGIPFKSGMQSGRHFACEYFSHTDMPDLGLAVNKGLYCFMIGRVFTNDLYSSELGLPLRELLAQDVIECYRQFGQDFIRYIKGTFLIVVCDEDNNDYLAYTSKSGMYRLYYAFVENRLILASSLNSIVNNLKSKPALDDLAILQHSVFEHTLGCRTFYRGISILDNYQYLGYDLKYLSTKAYYSIAEKLSNSATYSWKETKRMLPEAFNSAMDAATIDLETINSALTGGYDSRTILSYLLSRGISGCNYYTWAADKKWEDVSVASRLASSLNLPYKPIELGDEMLAHYLEYADKIVYWSDGSGSINRANQMYSHEKLSVISRNLITGYCGSELFRPLSRNNVMISNGFVDLLFSGNREVLAKELLEKRTTALLPAYVNEHRDAFVFECTDYFKQIEISENKYLSLFHYLVKTGFWKFFGQEIHSQRIHTRAISPFIDDDFVSFIVQTPIKAIHKESYRKQGLNSLRGQALYHPILKRNYPALMGFQTNRGFSPSDFRSFLYPFNILLKHYLSKRRQRVSGVVGFDSRHWNNVVYSKRSAVISRQDDVFASIDPNDPRAGMWYSLRSYLSKGEYC